MSLIVKVTTIVEYKDDKEEDRVHGKKASRKVGGPRLKRNLLQMFGEYTKLHGLQPGSASMDCERTGQTTVIRHKWGPLLEVVQKW